ncbi:hypothetical protein CsSME_00016700 [Camellia sinensis var. sinensis]
MWHQNCDFPPKHNPWSADADYHVFPAQQVWCHPKSFSMLGSLDIHSNNVEILDRSFVKDSESASDCGSITDNSRLEGTCFANESNSGCSLEWKSESGSHP